MKKKVEGKEQTFADFGLTPVVISVDKLIPYARNANTHSDEQITNIAASIKEFGFKVPIGVDAQNTVRAGHGRTRSCIKQWGRASLGPLTFAIYYKFIG